MVDSRKDLSSCHMTNQIKEFNWNKYKENDNDKS